MGEVYRARDRQLDRDVALKILPEALAADTDRLARFEREAKALASLNHPNIAQIYGVEGGPANHLRQGYGGQEALATFHGPPEGGPYRRRSRPAPSSLEITPRDYHIGTVELSGETSRMKTATGPSLSSSPSSIVVRSLIFSPRT